uniref:Uncharacterized protein n=1 Tax=Spongospora subterranea TaxID=70186 RepID=A0A0H5QLL3_9EUKA|eukprot:CRZ03040.1 hypothetical protein [Spongospora subterranea]
MEALYHHLRQDYLNDVLDAIKSGAFSHLRQQSRLDIALTILERFRVVSVRLRLLWFWTPFRSRSIIGVHGACFQLHLVRGDSRFLLLECIAHQESYCSPWVCI